MTPQDLAKMTDEQLLSILPSRSATTRPRTMSHIQLVCVIEYCRRHITEELILNEVTSELLPQLLKRYVKLHEAVSFLYSQYEVFEAKVDGIANEDFIHGE